MMVDIGLIGAGGISHAHRPAFRDFADQLRLTGVCDVDEEQAADVADEFDTDYWTDYEVFVEEADADAVDIALPHSLHYPAAKAALKADKHVFLEKPFATSMADCAELVALAGERDLRLMIGMVQRYHPRHHEVKLLLDDDVFGRIHAGRIDMLQSLPEAGFDPDHWLYDADLAGGGGILSVLVHKIDLLRYFVGDVERAIGLSVASTLDLQVLFDFNFDRIQSA